MVIAPHPLADHAGRAVGELEDHDRRQCALSNRPTTDPFGDHVPRAREVGEPAEVTAHEDRLADPPAGDGRSHRAVKVGEGRHGRDALRRGTFPGWR